MKKGTYVTRSAYQKVCEEKKKLIEDIKIMSNESMTYKKMITVQKWRSHFNREDSFKLMLKGIAKQYFKDKAKRKPTRRKK